MKSYIKSLVIEFYAGRKINIILVITSLLLTNLIDSNIVPFLTAKILNKNNIKDNLILLILIYILRQIFYLYYDNKYLFLKINFDKFITDKILSAALIKCDYDYININPSVIFNKINLIRDHTSWIINKIIFNIMPSIFSIAFIILKFYLINITLCYILLIGICIQCFVILKTVEPCIDKSYDDLTSRTNNLIKIEDKFFNIKTITNTLNGLEHEIEECKKLSSHVRKTTIDSSTCLLKNRTLSNTITTIYVLLIVYFSYNLYKKKVITYENFTSILLTLNQFMIIMNDINYYIPEIVNSLSVLKHNNEFIDSLLIFNDNSNYLLNNINFNSITLNHIYYKYDNNSDKYIIENFNKVFIKNKIYLIYGSSGSGKSTLINLICNNLTPSVGEILINNKYLLSDFSKESIKKNIFIINQNTNYLFNTTILENIAYITPITPKLLEKINFYFTHYHLDLIFKNIKSKDNFLNYKVGILGSKLSGGQKQVIHLLRLIVQNTSNVLILDESINAIDNDNKNNILNLIKDFSNNKIVIIITHDTTIKQFGDDIIYL